MSPARDLHFLIVDESRGARSQTRGLLEALGCRRAEEAADGHAALQRLRAQPIDLVVCAIEMPEMNGFELLRAIKADAALAQVPVLMVAARPCKDELLRAAQAGAAAYIVKPFDRATLECKLHRILHKLALPACA